MYVNYISILLLPKICNIMSDRDKEYEINKTDLSMKSGYATYKLTLSSFTLFSSPIKLR